MACFSYKLIWCTYSVGLKENTRFQLYSDNFCIKHLWKCSYKGNAGLKWRSHKVMWVLIILISCKCLWLWLLPYWGEPEWTPHLQVTHASFVSSTMCKQLQRKLENSTSFTMPWWNTQSRLLHILICFVSSTMHGEIPGLDYCTSLFVLCHRPCCSVGYDQRRNTTKMRELYRLRRDCKMSEQREERLRCSLAAHVTKQLA